MARQPRFFVPGQPLHVIQRGNNRAAIFRKPGDYRIFFEFLSEAVRGHGVDVHAYVLMTNHCHMLATPHEADSLPKALQSVGRRYVQHFNWVYERTGTLWEGRYRASLVHSARYLFSCMRYIELNPVRAGMVARPAEYLWSSHGCNARGVPDPLVTEHPLYTGLAQTASERRRAYANLFASPISDDELEEIRTATNRHWALGDEDFRNDVASASGRPAAPSRRGRRYHDAANRV